MEKYFLQKLCKDLKEIAKLYKREIEKKIESSQFRAFFQMEESKEIFFLKASFSELTFNNLINSKLFKGQTMPPLNSFEIIFKRNGKLELLTISDRKDRKKVFYLDRVQKMFFINFLKDLKKIHKVYKEV